MKEDDVSKKMKPGAMDTVSVKSSKANPKTSPWPTRDSGKIPGDGRTWADMDNWLRRRGTSLDELVELLRRQEMSKTGGT